MDEPVIKGGLSSDWLGNSNGKGGGAKIANNVTTVFGFDVQNLIGGIGDGSDVNKGVGVYFVVDDGDFGRAGGDTGSANSRV